MEIRRFFIEPANRQNDLVTIKGDEFVHLKKVLRLKAGFKIIVCFNDGYEHYCTLVTVADKYAVAKIDLSKKTDDTLYDVTLFAGLLKGGKIDFVIQKCVELGVKKIVPYISKNTVEKNFNPDRANKISFEAAKQCGSSLITEVTDAVTFDDVLRLSAGFKNKCFFYEDERENSIEKFSLKQGDTAVVVGSEGGFTPEEAESANLAGFNILSLGKRVLRAETACVVSSALILYKLGAFGV